MAAIKFEADEIGGIQSPKNLKSLNVSSMYKLPLAPPKWTSHPDGHPFQLAYSCAQKFRPPVSGSGWQRWASTWFGDFEGKLRFAAYGAALSGAIDATWPQLWSPRLVKASYGYSWWTGPKAFRTNMRFDNEFFFHGKWCGEREAGDSVYKFTWKGWGLAARVGAAPRLPSLCPAPPAAATASPPIATALLSVAPRKRHRHSQLSSTPTLLRFGGRPPLILTRPAHPTPCATPRRRAAPPPMPAALAAVPPRLS